MIRRAIFTSLVIIAANLTGCAYHMQQCGPGGCGAGVGAVGACQSCGRIGCGGACMMGPLAMLHQKVTCGAGCGRLYVNEWINDPPANCDPCDDYGNWIGPRCCHPRVWGWMAGMRSLWGFRYDQPGVAGAACTAGCDHGHAPADFAVHEGEVIYDGPVRENGTMQNQEEELRPPVPEPAEPRAMRSVKKPWRQSAAEPYYSRSQH